MSIFQSDLPGAILEYVQRLHSRSEAVTDSELLDRFVERQDSQAFEALLARYGPMVLGVCHRVLITVQDAEDAFQATFLVLAQKASSIQPRSQVGNWLYGVAYRTALQARKSRERRERGRVPLGEVPEKDFHNRQLQMMLDEELLRLPSYYRTVLLLCDLQGWTREEAAQQLGWPPGTVAGRLARARKLLAKKLTQAGFTLPCSVGFLLKRQVSGMVPSPLHIQTSGLVVSTAQMATSLSCSSLAVMTLAKKVVQIMFLQKIKGFLFLGSLLVGLSVGIGHFTVSTLASEQGKPSSHSSEPSEKATSSLLQKKQQLEKDIQRLEDLLRIAKEIEEKQQALKKVNEALEKMNKGKPRLITRNAPEALRIWKLIQQINQLNKQPKKTPLPRKPESSSRGIPHKKSGAVVALEHLLAGQRALKGLPPILPPTKIPVEKLKKLIKPLLFWTGINSQIKQPHYERISSSKQWKAIWLKHYGKTAQEAFTDRIPRTEIDFERCMVLAIFQGEGINSRGLTLDSIQEESERIRVRFDEWHYQTDANGGADRCQSFAFVVIPRSTKPVIVEENIQGLKGQPPKYRVRAILDQNENIEPKKDN